ncbi:MAG: hypothetical protein KIS96_11450 [Bauldia sp.]|nr:hypothetical protein [Bauldia sp.]
MFDDTHRRVAVGVLPSGKMIKIDGHTRAFVWAGGLAQGVPTPLVLDADVYKLRDREAAVELYTRFDSRVAVETAQDQLFGAAREADLHFESPMLRAGRYGNALKHLYQVLFGVWGERHSDARFTYRVVDYFKPELLRFDAAKPVHSDYTGIIIAGAILTFMRHGDDALEFWGRYGRNEGIKDRGSCDGVQAVRNLLSYVRVEKKHGSSHFEEILGRTVNGYEMFRSGRLYTGKGGLPHAKKGDELQRFIDDARKAKERRG